MKPKRGRILRLKEGYNPNSSSLGSVVFSFPAILLSIPVIAAAGVYGALRIVANDASINWFQFGLGVALSALAGWLCIAAFLALLKRIGLVPFVIYRLVLGAALLWIAF